MATIGLSKPYYAIYAEAGGVVSYSDGAVMGKATEANISIETTEDNNLYGDNGLAETDRRFANGTLTLSTTDLSQEVSKAILGLTEQQLTEPAPYVRVLALDADGRAILRAVQSAGSAYGLIGWEDLPR